MAFEIRFYVYFLYELLPMDAIAVRPFLEEDLANLVANVPVSLAGDGDGGVAA